MNSGLILWLSICGVAVPLFVVAIRFAIGVKQASGNKGKPLICRACGKTDVRPSWQSGITDQLLIWSGRLPFRCRACRHRFYRLRRDCVNLEAAQSDADKIPST